EEKYKYIGLAHFTDVSDKSFFWIWTGDTKVVKIDRKSGKISRFGKRTTNYVPPRVKSEIKRAFHNMDHRESYKHERDFSMVRDIFVTSSNTVGVVYVGPYKKNNSLPVYIQFHTDAGKFLEEVHVSDVNAASHYEVYFYYRKADKRFYILDTETSDQFDQNYQLHQYAVEE
ncbi:MAG: hypothetical protein GY765_07210, partial [bacterium]|nr:hypothetical protein [bacterium]